MQSLRNLIAATVLAVAAAPALATEPEPSSQAENLRAYADLIRAQGEYELRLAEARLAYAQSLLVEAQVQGELQRVRQMRQLVDREELVLRRLRRDEHQLRAKAERIEDHARSANVILAGNVSVYGVRALRFLIVNAVDPAVSFEAMTESLTDVSDADFEFAAGKEPIPFTGTSVGELVDFLATKSPKVRPWSPAHRAIAQLVVTLSQSAQDRLDAIAEDLRQLDEGFDPFDLPPNGSSSSAN